MPVKKKAKPPAKRKAGRPPYSPEPEHSRTVQMMAAAGITQADMAIALGIDEKTLRKHFRAELDRSMVQVTASITNSLVAQALAGNMTAAIFFLKARAGWSEKQGIEVSGPNGGAIEVSGDATANARLAAIVARFAVPAADAGSSGDGANGEPGAAASPGL